MSSKESASQKKACAVRLQKYIAHQGIASRRQAEELIANGAVKVNGTVITEMGVKVVAGKDIIEVSDTAIEEKKEQLVYFMLHKPTGYVTTTHRTRHEPKIILDLVSDIPERVYPVGRLDKESSGLLFLTNDGDLTFQLTHPQFEHEKEYLVETTSSLQPEQIQKLRSGMVVLGQKTLPPQITLLSPYRFKITLKEGKNRQIRRILRSVGSGVKKLKRIRMGQVLLDAHLKPGQFRTLTAEEIRILKES